MLEMGGKIAVDYRKLFHRLINENMSNAALAQQAGITLNVVTRLKRNEYVSLESIEKLCMALGYGVDDILEFDMIPKKQTLNNWTP